jgi:hypothetical protein
MQNHFFYKGAQLQRAKRTKIELGLVFMDTDIVYKFQMIFLMSSFNLNGFQLNLLFSRILKVEINGILK